MSRARFVVEDRGDRLVVTAHRTSVEVPARVSVDRWIGGYPRATLPDGYTVEVCEWDDGIEVALKPNDETIDFSDGIFPSSRRAAMRRWAAYVVYCLDHLDRKGVRS